MASRRTRPGSPIGRKGPRKSNPKYKQRSGEPWDATEVKELKSLAKQNTSTGVIRIWKAEEAQTSA